MAVTSLRLRLCIRRVISMFKRRLVAAEAGVEPGNFALCLNLGLAASNILGGDDRLGSSDIRLCGRANSKEQVERHQRRFRRRRYPHAMTKDYSKAVHRVASYGRSLMAWRLGIGRY